MAAGNDPILRQSRNGSPGQPESAPGEKGGRMLGEFKDFAMRGSMIDMAVGIIVGAAFGRVVTINMSKM